MASGKYSFTVEQGTTTEFEIVWADSAGAPVNLTDYGAKMQIRSDYGSASTLYGFLSSSIDADGTGLNMNGTGGSKPLSSGSIGLVISAASSSAFSFNEARYDLELISGSNVTRLIEGKIRLSKEVTI